jgi:hypothetical protein
MEGMRSSAVMAALGSGVVRPTLLQPSKTMDAD